MRNTEQMVSVPREHDLKICRTPLDDLLSGAKTGEIRDCSNREFAAGDTVLLREVDDARAYTGRTTRRTITHVQKYYGLPDHLCVLSYAQHQGEPVALPARKPIPNHATFVGGSAYYAKCFDQAQSWNACLDEIAKLGPLYTHPAPVQQGEPVAWMFTGDDGHTYFSYSKQTPEHKALYTHANAGEVEQGYHDSVVEGLVNRQNELREERDTLRAQLAERDARLGIYESFPGYLIDRCEGDTIYEESLQHWLADHIKSISASAEPKCQDGGMCADSSHKCTGCARDERDERAEFEADWAHRMKVAGHRERANAFYRIQPTDRYRWNDVQDAWDAWQARAAMERKP